jgi:hypothetical protein
MAIYEAGGHFDVHRDHVVSADHQGTLLIEVRSEHTGGDLVLSHNGSEYRWSIGTTEEFNQSHLPQLRWIAFFTDIDHRVEPVSTGVRIVLQFDIHIVETSKTRIVHERYSSRMADGEYFGLPITNTLTSNLMRSLQDLVSDSRGIALPLFHLYTDAILDPDRLKLKDLELFQTFLNHDYCVQLVPIMIVHREDFRDKEGNSSDEEEAACEEPFIPGYSIRPIPTTERGFVLTEVDHGDGDGDAATTRSLTACAIHQLPPRITYIATGYEQTRYLHSILTGAYIGNDADTSESHYFCVVFLITTKLVTMVSA